MARSSQHATTGLRPPPASARWDVLSDPLADPLASQQSGMADTGDGSFGGALQLKATVSSPSYDRKLASQGLSGGGGALPFRDEIESSFGADLSDVRVHTGGSASAACDSLGAEGYTMGRDIAFASSSPSKELVAHEAAHVVQQSGGVHLSSKVGSPGDSYEIQADAAADRVMAGQSARDLLPSGGLGGGEAVQFKRASKDNSGWTTTDNGLVLMSDTQNLYADQGLIDAANSKLENVGKDGSFITLASDGQKYKHEGHDLTRVVPKWVDHDDMGDHQGASDANESGVEDSNGVTNESSVDDEGVPTMALWADCGRSSGAVTGSLKQNNSDRQAVYKKGGSEKLTRGRADKNMNKTANTSVGRMANAIYFDLMPGFIADKGNIGYLTEGVHYTKGDKDVVTPKPIPDGVVAQKMYSQMSSAGQDAFDKAAAINAYANPEIGEAYAMATGYDMHGFKKLQQSTWNFHWGGVIMKDGPDNVTLENYAVIAKGIDRFINRDWNFAIYGTMASSGGAKDTFHAEHLGSKTHGSHATSMAVRTDK